MKNKITRRKKNLYAMIKELDHLLHDGYKDPGDPMSACMDGRMLLLKIKRNIQRRSTS